MIWLVALVSCAVGAGVTAALIPYLRKVGMLGKDVHKPGRPEVAEMGGLALVVGFGAGVLLAIALEAFSPHLLPLDFTRLLAVLATVLLTALVGIADDLLGIPQSVKALLPVVAALPLVAIRAGETAMVLPWIGKVEFGLFYPLFLVPAAVTGAANAVNMLAGFNGLELGMGVVAMGALAVVAAHLGQTTALVMLLAGIGACLGVLLFNWYPARIFVGDVGTLAIGAILASACIVGNFELAGVVLIIPYALDFLIKAGHRFPSSGWWGELGPDGKLRCPSHGPVGLAQAVLKLTRGLSERSLVLVLIGFEALFGLIAILLYLPL